MRSRELERFTFEIYDSDGKGTLSKHELHDVLVKIHGKKEVETKLASILELMDIDHNNGIDIDEFLCHIKKFPVLMFPVFAIQDTMRQYIIGESFWQAKEEDAIRYKETPVVQKMLARSFSHKHLHNIQPIKHHHLGSSTPDNSASRAHAGGKDPSHSRSKGSESNNDDNTSTLYRVGKGEETGAAKAPVKSPRKSVDEELEGSTSRSRSKTPRRSSTSTLPSDVACAPGPAPRRHSLTVDTVGGGQGSHARHHHEVGATPKHGHDTPKHGHDAASKHHHEVVTPKHGHDAKHNHSTSHGSINPGGPIIIKYM